MEFSNNTKAIYQQQQDFNFVLMPQRLHQFSQVYDDFGSQQQIWEYFNPLLQSINLNRNRVQKYQINEQQCLMVDNMLLFEKKNEVFIHEVDIRVKVNSRAIRFGSSSVLSVGSAEDSNCVLEVHECQQ